MLEGKRNHATCKFELECYFYVSIELGSGYVVEFNCCRTENLPPKEAPLLHSNPARARARASKLQLAEAVLSYLACFSKLVRHLPHHHDHTHSQTHITQQAFACSGTFF